MLLRLKVTEGSGASGRTGLWWRGRRGGGQRTNERKNDWCIDLGSLPMLKREVGDVGGGRGRGGGGEGVAF